jgi:peptidoglycan/xylan/chitin deacetylase (PgdA/CDA1 family)
MTRAEKTICLGHDIERGHGHRDDDPSFSALADRLAPGSLDEMLAIEKDAKLTGTYHVVGCIFAEVADRIRADGHAIGFHSYDHAIDRPQLARCRAIDPTVKGYRPPQSRITPELTDRALRRHGFQWLASSVRSLGTARPEWRRGRLTRAGLARIPILFDDYDLHTGALTYPAWEDKALDAIGASDFVAFCLHDCYAPHWLPHYRRFLERVASAGRFRTLDEVATELMADAR